MTKLNIQQQHALVNLSSWKKLDQCSQGFEKNFDLMSAFSNSPDRVKTMQASACGIHLDYSKNLVDPTVWQSLLSLADESQLKTAIQRLFSGETVNYTEQRAAKHTTLRDPSIHHAMTMEHQELAAVFDRMATVVDRLRTGQWLGATQKSIRSVVNLGIGGSDLGPKMVLAALQPYIDTSLSLHFVSNIDDAHLSETLVGLDPETTLFIISSKSFTTQETLQNWSSAQQWLQASLKGKDLSAHSIAVTTNVKRAEQFGIAADHILCFPEWVGGRYSVWSPIGLPVALGIGMTQYKQFLQGAYEMDCHYQQAPWHENLPVILALLGIWYHNFLDCQTLAVIPYSYSLRYFTDYLQQLDMESNGKSVSQHGHVHYATAPIVWGNPGTNGQHAFFQLLHQGRHLVPIDFILPAQSEYKMEGHHQKLIANCLGQARALMVGDKQVDPNRYVSGNKPCNLIVYPKTSPYYLGALLALYEHKVYTQSVIWQINAFDQYGVELGKRISSELEQALENPACAEQWDSSTQQLLAVIREMQS
jgi:glucose-6-phosphate isomerase